MKFDSRTVIGQFKQCEPSVSNPEEKVDFRLYPHNDRKTTFSVQMENILHIFSVKKRDRTETLQIQALCVAFSNPVMNLVNVMLCVPCRQK